jgi:hypothetical protein
MSRPTNVQSAATIESGYISIGPIDPGTVQQAILAGPFDRDIKIDAVSLMFDVANGSALTGNLMKVANGANLNTNIDISVANEMNFNGARNTLVEATILFAAGQNILRKGERVGVEFNVAPAAGLGLIFGTIRYSTVLT